MGWNLYYTGIMPFLGHLPFRGTRKTICGSKTVCGLLRPQKLFFKGMSCMQVLYQTMRRQFSLLLCPTALRPTALFLALFLLPCLAFGAPKVSDEVLAVD